MSATGMNSNIIKTDKMMDTTQISLTHINKTGTISRATASIVQMYLPLIVMVLKIGDNSLMILNNNFTGINIGLNDLIGA